MGKCVIVGAGPVGRETARLMALQGEETLLVSRAGKGIQDPRVKGVSADATDGETLSRLCAGAEVIFMCAMAPYHQWPAGFPPIMSGVVAAAQRVGARLVVLGNVYGYGEAAPAVLVPDLPLAPTTVKGRVRVAMWQQALQSTVPALEVRASDFLGDGAFAQFLLLSLPPLLAGRPAVVIPDPDVPHAWSFTRDVARTLVAASRYQGAWGRAFHVPSQHVSSRELVARFAAAAGLAKAEVDALTDEQFKRLAREDKNLNEVVEMGYLFRKPLTLDASETERLLGIQASSLEEAILDTLHGMSRSA